MKHLLLILTALTLLTACHKDKDEKEPKIAKQSVLVYMAGDCSLNSFVMSDLRQMMEGSKLLGDGNHLLAFVDQTGRLPYLLEIANGDTTRVYTYEQEMKSSDPATLKTTINYLKSNYRAENYGLVLWGHADGWVVWEPAAKNAPRRAYGQDVTGGEQWMNIDEMADALESTFPDAPLRFIFADCCCFQSIESAYELRHCTDMIIASAAEIPGEGAPYQTVIPALFSQQDDYYRQAIDAYYAQESYGYQEPLSAIRTSEMENLAEATRVALATSLQPLGSDGTGYPDVKGLIYFYDYTLFDMNDFFLRHADSNTYAEWHRTFQSAVVYRTWVDAWMANHVAYVGSFGSHLFQDFDVTDERFGGVNMFVPQNPESVPYAERSKVTQQNERIRRMEWYKAAGLDALGW